MKFADAPRPRSLAVTSERVREPLGNPTHGPHVEGLPTFVPGGAYTYNGSLSSGLKAIGLGWRHRDHDVQLTRIQLLVQDGRGADVQLYRDIGMNRTKAHKRLTEVMDRRRVDHPSTDLANITGSDFVRPAIERIELTENSARIHRCGLRLGGWDTCPPLLCEQHDAESPLELSHTLSKGRSADAELVSGIGPPTMFEGGNEVRQLR